MSKLRGRKREKLTKGRRQRQSPILLLLLLIFWCILIGWGIELALGATDQPLAQGTTAVIGTVDPVPERYQLGQELYLKNCGSCHIALPPQVMPSETWRQLLLDLDQHYGQKLESIFSPSLLMMWNYLRDFSRPLKEEEAIPYRVKESRYFKALHPRVDFPEPARLTTCVSCHSGASEYDYRSLTPDWENSL
ncbi:MAG: cytochrome C [Coleofasciculaceae cyanobacterium]